MIILGFAAYDSGGYRERAELLWRRAFTATSAVCVTGLVVQDTATYWSEFGQVVIISLIRLRTWGDYGCTFSWNADEKKD